MMRRLCANSRFSRDNRGTALVEFAVSLPFLVLLFVGGFQISDAVFAYRKVTAATKTVADLTTQYTAVTDGDLDTILNASQQVLAPYKVANAQLKVTQITINSAGVATVDWSRAKNATAYSPGTTFTVPASFRRNNTTLIVSEVTYSYVPSIASSLIGNLSLTDRIDMNPRKSVTITKL